MLYFWTCIYINLTMSLMMKKYIFYLLVLICAGTIQAQTLSQAKRLFENGEFGKAKEAFAKLIKRSPSSAEVNYFYGASLYETGELDKCVPYLEKSAISGKKHFVDCRPKIVFSNDECRSWSEPVEITDVPSAYFVVNNDRLVQLKSGRLILPAAHHQYKDAGKFGTGIIKFFLSDDNGKSWRLSKHYIYPVANSMLRGLMEPGVIELKDGTLMCFIRTAAGCQYKAFSKNGGESWSAAEPAKEFRSPESPLSMKRDPANGKIYAVWNDHSKRALIPASSKFWKRSPLVIAESTDEGVSWQNHRVLEKSENHGFCYIAMLFDGAQLYLGYCCGGSPGCSNPLQETRIRVLKLR